MIALYPIDTHCSVEYTLSLSWELSRPETYFKTFYIFFFVTTCHIYFSEASRKRIFLAEKIETRIKKQEQNIYFYRSKVKDGEILAKNKIVGKRKNGA